MQRLAILRSCVRLTFWLRDASAYGLIGPDGIYRVSIGNAHPHPQTYLQIQNSGMEAVSVCITDGPGTTFAYALA